MRTFHIGGAAQRGAEQSSVEAAFDATVEIKNRNVVMNSIRRPGGDGPQSRDRAARRGRAARRRAIACPTAPGCWPTRARRCSSGERLAEWDPYTIPIITEKDGIAHYVDLIEGLSMREVVDEATGISSKVVIDWKQQPRGSELRPRITLRDEEGEVMMLGNGLEARYFMSVDAILSVENGRRSKPATSSPASRANPRRPATSPAVCRASPSCSRRASPRISRSSARATGGSSSARTTRPSGASSWSRPRTAASRSNT